MPDCRVHLWVADVAAAIGPADEPDGLVQPAGRVQALPVEQVCEHGRAGDDAVLDQTGLEGDERVEEQPRADPLLGDGSTMGSPQGYQSEVTLPLGVRQLVKLAKPCPNNRIVWFKFPIFLQKFRFCMLPFPPKIGFYPVFHFLQKSRSHPYLPPGSEVK